MKLLLATRNPGKVRELRDLIGSAAEVESLADHPDLPEVAETGQTFEENARKKALECAKAAGMASLADDSGLCIDALGGRPGLRSARYAPGTDQARVEKVLSEMADVAEDRRGAVFRCALCLALPDGWSVTEVGECRGRIARAPRGENGFGYDPVFLLPELRRTLAELTPGEKGQLSHRARAWARMRPHLRGLTLPPRDSRRR